MLEAGDWQADILPAIGGSLSGLRLRGHDILRPMPKDSNSPLDAACFPMVPFCNRINQGRFTFAGTEIRLEANHPPEPHCLHGLGWQRAWLIDELGSDFAQLSDEYVGGGPWPWAYRAKQRFELTEHGLYLTLEVTNHANVPMPTGLGLHPYFRRRPETQLKFASRSVVMTDASNIPDGVLLAGNHWAEWQTGAGLPPQLVDHTHLGWTGEVQIADHLGSITMRAAGTPHLHIYVPQDGQTLCCEPVTHAADAFNQDPAAMSTLPPGATKMITMQILATLAGV